MRILPASIGITGMVVLAFLTHVLNIAGAQPPIRPPTNPGTPALVPSGPNAEAMALVALKKAPASSDAASNPTEAAPGANPPGNVDGNFLVGPTYAPAPELTENPDVPKGKVQQFSMDSALSKFYPGIGRKVFGT